MSVFLCILTWRICALLALKLFVAVSVGVSFILFVGLFI